MTQTATSPQRKPLLDEASFQKLLQAAHVLQDHNDKFRGQEVHEDFARNLAAIVDTQKTIQSLQLDLAAAAELVAARTQKIARASGAAIGILEKNRLFYRAATGSASADSGRRISREDALSAECLRDGEALHYADATADAVERKERFRAQDVKAFIAVPVYHGGQVAGVLELRFAQAGTFRESDIRAAELMSGLLSEAMATGAQAAWKEAPVSERRSMLEALQRIQPQLGDAGSESQGLESTASAIKTPLPETASPAPSARLKTEGAPPAEAVRSAKVVKCPVCGSDFFDESEAFCGICGSPRIVRSRSVPAVDPPSPVLEPYVPANSGNGKAYAEVAPSRKAALAGPDVPESLQELIELCAQHERATLEAHAERPLPAAREPLSESAASRVVPRARQEPVTLPETPASRSASTGLEHGAEEAAARQQSLLRVFPSDLATPAEAAGQYPWGSAKKAQEWLQTVKAQRRPGADWLAQQWQRRRANIYVAVATLILMIVILGWGNRQVGTPVPAQVGVSTRQKPPEPQLTPFEKLLVSIGLAEAPPPAQVYTGNPDVRVWVDVHTALYHCPGSEAYGKTPDGRYATQLEAQEDQFEPANRKACP